MTCQHCETWILDDDYRCSRCGRRVRNTPVQGRQNRIPFETGAAARAYQIDYQAESRGSYEAQSILDSDPDISSEPPETDTQPRLFEGAGSNSRVIAFESLTSRAERQSIHARAAGLSRPAPLKSERIQVRHARPARTQAFDQRKLEFDGQEDILPQPRRSLICDAPVAPARLRLEATFIDGCLIAIPCLVAFLVFAYASGSVFDLVRTDRYALPLLAASLGTIPILYKLLWVIAGCDSFGMQRAGLCLVDFDGNPPSRSRRYQRFIGSLLSLSAAGIGLIWSLVDEDRLAWHDHISNTFPTLHCWD